MDSVIFAFCCVLLSWIMWYFCRNFRSLVVCVLLSFSFFVISFIVWYCLSLSISSIFSIFCDMGVFSLLLAWLWLLKICWFLF